MGTASNWLALLNHAPGVKVAVLAQELVGAVVDTPAPAGAEPVLHIPQEIAALLRPKAMLTV